MPVPAELYRSAELFRKRFTGVDVRWMKQEQLHITLLPPWQCTDTGEICRRVQEIAARCDPIELFFDTLTVGPSRRKPGIIWATGKTPARLDELHRELQKTLGCFVKGCDRDFLLHLTLARFRAGGAAAAALKSLHEPVEWYGSFTSLVLYESILRPEGARYQVLCRYGFNG